MEKEQIIEGMQIRICNACKQYKNCDKELCTMSGLVAKELSRFYQPKEQTKKETAKKLIRLIEFHSISKRDESGYETFTISNLCLREILREEFGFTNEELETIWEIDKGENK